MNVIGDRNSWVSNSDAPKNAATDPAPASAMASGSNGAFRLAGGASSKVSTVSTSAASETPATTKKRGPPRVGLRLDAADRGAERDGAEDAQIHDHRGL